MENNKGLKPEQKYPINKRFLMGLGAAMNALIFIYAQPRWLVVVAAIMAQVAAWALGVGFGWEDATEAKEQDGEREVGL